MTTDTSAEALEESIFWLKAKYRRHGEIEDRIAAEQLEYFQAEKRRAREGVTDELIRRALVMSRNTIIQTGHLAKAPDEQRLRAALEAVWPDGREAKEGLDVYVRDETLHCDISDDPQNQFSIMIREDGLTSFAAYFRGDKVYGPVVGAQFTPAFLRWLENSSLVKDTAIKDTDHD